MTVQFVEGMAMQTLSLVLIVSMPVLTVALVVGLTMSIIQATTQVNEMTLAFIPKIVAVYLTLIAASGFMIDRLVDFTHQIFSDFSRFTL